VKNNIAFNTLDHKFKRIGITMSNLQSTIEQAFEDRMNITPKTVSIEVKQAVLNALAALNDGSARVAEKVAGEWVVHQWLKKAVLLSFRIWDNAVIDGAESTFFDKVPMKYTDYTQADFEADGVRVVPGASVRTGSFIGKNVVVMPSFVNIGAYVDEGCMVDAWATVGSCAQIGKNVHLSGGVGIGGVLEPLQAGPTIIEDNCFIGARSEIVEGESTRIFDRETGEIHYGRVPAGSVVVPGNLPSKCGTYSLYAAIIVKKVDAKTRAKVGINALLRSVSEE
jgi:2,3,4,5-tetrahydropyridine-2-carboxylate N-succinyltransferase